MEWVRGGKCTQAKSDDADRAAFAEALCCGCAGDVAVQCGWGCSERRGGGTAKGCHAEGCEAIAAFDTSIRGFAVAGARVGAAKAKGYLGEDGFSYEECYEELHCGLL
jgi:hypothetical protein